MHIERPVPIPVIDDMRALTNAALLSLLASELKAGILECDTCTHFIMPTDAFTVAIYPAAGENAWAAEVLHATCARSERDDDEDVIVRETEPRATRDLLDCPKCASYDIMTYTPPESGEAAGWLECPRCEYGWSAKGYGEDEAER